MSVDDPGMRRAVSGNILRHQKNFVESNILLIFAMPNTKKMYMKKFKVTMNERQRDGSIRTLVQQAFCRDCKEVVEWYGLNEPDIVSYTIEEEN